MKITTGHIKAVTMAILFSMLCACASAPSGPQFSSLKEPSPGKARIYIYRPDVYYGKAITYSVLLNKKKISDIGNLGFFTIELDPGKYTIEPDTQSIDNSLDIILVENSVTFLRLKTNERPPLCFCTSLQFEVIEKNMALIELKNTREEVSRVYFK